MRALGPFLRDAWHLARPYFSSDERWFARGMLAVIVALNLLTVGLSVVFNFWNRSFYNALQAKDWSSFVDLLLTWHHGEDGLMPGFTGLAAIYILVAIYKTYLSQWLRIRWRAWMTEKLLTQWLADQAYYRISLQPQPDIGTDNPDQRIAEDLNSFVTETLSLALDLMSNVVTLISFIAILWSLSGPLVVLGIAVPGYMVWVALAYSGLGTWITHLIGKPLAKLNFRQQRVEADFRFALVRLRENVEGVALYGGEAEEHRGLSGRFAEVVANWWLIMRRMKLLNGLIAGYSQVAVIFPIVVAAPAYFAGKLELGGMMQTVDAFGQVQGAMSWFVNSYSSLASWRATVERLATFQRAIAKARADSAHGIERATAADAAGYSLEDLVLTLSDGATLSGRQNLTLKQGESVVITGRSGSGKSTLFRALAGIWPFGSGRVIRPSGRVLFLPQRPYIPLGTLRHAVTYPGVDADDAAITTALTDAGLPAFAGRLNDEDSWAQRLSGGEQQRLAIARALLVKPDWLFLDEATSSLDPQSVAAIHDVLAAKLPRTTIVSIAHDSAVTSRHARHLVFERGVGLVG